MHYTTLAVLGLSFVTSVLVAALFSHLLIGGGLSYFAVVRETSRVHSLYAQTAGTTYYVNNSPTGCGGSVCSNTANNGLSTATAFFDLDGCITKMSGGDTCLIMDGGTPYVGYYPDHPRWDFAPVARNLSGTAQRPTTIKNYPGHQPRICPTSTCVPFRNTSDTIVFGMQAAPYGSSSTHRNYMHFEGLHIVGGIEFHGAQGAQNIGNITFRNNEIEGCGAVVTNTGGNRNMVRWEEVHDSVFDHNYLHNMQCFTGATETMLRIFRGTNLLVEYNTFDFTDAVPIGGSGYGDSTAIDDKDRSRFNVHRYNHFIGTAGSEATIKMQQQGDGWDTQVYGNLFINGSWNPCDGGHDRLIVHHNTFVTDQSGSSGRAGMNTCRGDSSGRYPYNRWTDNLVYSPTAPHVQMDISRLFWSEDAMTEHWIMDYNVYSASSDYFSDRYGSSPTNHTSLASWRTALQAGNCTGLNDGDCEQHSQETDACTVTCTTLTNGTCFNATAGICLTASSAGSEVGYGALTSCVGHTCGQQAQIPAGPVCGNGVRESGEQCDGSDLGSATCQSQGYVSGALGCTSSCAFNTNACVAASCSDGIKNQNETDVDCGGSCSACVNGRMCSANADCQSGLCSTGICTAQQQQQPQPQGTGTKTWGEGSTADYTSVCEDTFINLNTTKYNQSAQLNLYTWPAQSIANAILFRCNLSNLPTNAVITNAQLQLYQYEGVNAAGDTVYNSGAHKVINRNPVYNQADGNQASNSSAWTANTCCRNGIPMAQADLGSAENTQPLSTATGWKTWTVTNMVQGWVNTPSSNYGLLVNSDAAARADSYRTFRSNEYSDASLRPKLIISYSIGGASQAPADTTAPTVSVTSPSANATISGSVTVNATASDNTAVASVQFKLNGTNLGPADTSSPYAISWNTVSSQNGSHQLSAVATDTAGNTAQAVNVTVIVDNAAPVISNIRATSTATTFTDIVWTTNEPATSRVEYGTTASYGSAVQNTSLVTDHTLAIANLVPGTTYHFRAISADALGNSVTSSNQTFSTTAVVAVCSPNWSCTEWSACSHGGTQTRTCTDQNQCANASGKPAEMRLCSPTSTPGQSGGGSTSGGGSSGGSSSGGSGSGGSGSGSSGGGSGSGSSGSTDGGSSSGGTSGGSSSGSGGGGGAGAVPVATGGGQATVIPDAQVPSNSSNSSSGQQGQSSGTDECGASQGNLDLSTDHIRTVHQQEQSKIKRIATSLRDRLLGRILLQVESHGEAWYVDPVAKSRFYLANGRVAYEALRTFGLGVTNSDLAKIPIGLETRFPDCDSDHDGLPDKLEEGLFTDPHKADTDGDGFSDGDEVRSGYSPTNASSARPAASSALIEQLKGRILLQVQEKGQAWYVNPVDGRRYYLKNGNAAYQIMKFLSVGITNADLSQIGVGETVEDIAP